MVMLVVKLATLMKIMVLLEVEVLEVLVKQPTPVVEQLVTVVPEETFLIIHTLFILP